MHKILSISLAFWLFLGSLLPHNDMEELFKIPSLLQHLAQEHTQLNLLEFLDLHYLSGDKEADKQQSSHQNLPFYNHVCSGIFFIIFGSQINILHQTFFSLHQDFSSLYIEHYYFRAVFSLLEPPQFAV